MRVCGSRGDCSASGLLVSVWAQMTDGGAWPVGWEFPDFSSAAELSSPWDGFPRGRRFFRSTLGASVELGSLGIAFARALACPRDGLA